jgi:hypothetical protein
VDVVGRLPDLVAQRCDVFHGGFQFNRKEHKELKDCLLEPVFCALSVLCGSIQNSFFTARTRWERRDAFIPDSGAERFLIGSTNVFRRMLNGLETTKRTKISKTRFWSPFSVFSALFVVKLLPDFRFPPKNRARCAGLSSFSAVSRFPRSFAPFPATNLRHEHNGTPRG